MIDADAQFPQNPPITDKINYSSKFGKDNDIKNQQVQPIQYPTFSNTPLVYQKVDEYLSENNIPFQNQVINQPLVKNDLPIKYEDDTHSKQRIFIKNINLLLLYQQLFQVLLSFISYNFIDFYCFYSNFFYKNQFEIRITFFLIIIKTAIFLLIVRFNKQLRKGGMNQFVYAIYFTLYTLSANCIALGSNYFLFKYQQNSMYFIIYYFSNFNQLISLAILIQLIVIQASIMKIKRSNMNLTTFYVNSCYSLFFVLFWVFLFPRQEYYDSNFEVYQNLFPIFCPFIFTSFYVPSLLQVYKGKFQLESQQTYIGSVLVQINMFLLCISDKKMEYNIRIM